MLRRPADPLARRLQRHLALNNGQAIVLEAFLAAPAVTPDGVCKALATAGGRGQTTNNVSSQVSQLRGALKDVGVALTTLRGDDNAHNRPVVGWSISPDDRAKLELLAADALAFPELAPEEWQLTPVQHVIVNVLLAKMPGAATRAEVIDALNTAGYKGDSHKIVDVHFFNIRAKLEKHPPFAIVSAWGEGWKFTQPGIVRLREHLRQHDEAPTR